MLLTEYRRQDFRLLL